MPNNTTAKTDAVCFTARPDGARFSDVVIHAFLPSDRPAPKLAVGISSGALSAAGMERAYREVNQSDSDAPNREVARWRWFRRFLDAITKAPPDVICWSAGRIH